MNELHFAYQVRQYLNRGLNMLSPETVCRLALSRQNALECQKQRVSQSVLATANGLAQHHFDNLHLKQILTALALLLCLAFSTFWVADRHVTELGAIDSALLADDLPIGVFTDKGFDVWLKRESSD